MRIRFKAAQPAGAPPRDAGRHLLTLRLTQLLWYQTLTLSVVAFYSPSDQDASLRPTAAYNVTDQFTLTAGANIFLGLRLTYRF